MSADKLTLSLISHTNVGKTTLARTLLKRDIGEIADRAHVTDSSEAFELLQTASGDTLLLWDTPGFGDTARLLTRLRNAKNPLGWILTQVWDRFRDRPMWCSQQAIRNVKEEADIVLYLINSSEPPEASGFIAMEMEILSWIGRPVIVLLNQTGLKISDHEMEAWRTHLEGHHIVRDTLAMDAFARCWVQEDSLMRSIAKCADKEKKPLAHKLELAWRSKNLETFNASVNILAKQLAETAADEVALDRMSWTKRIRQLLAPAIGSAQPSAKENAMAELASRLDTRIRSSLQMLIELNGLEGKAAGDILERMRESFAANEPVDEGVAAIIGGFVTGALGGLAADLAAGGLTFGGGAVVGGILGAAGAGGLAKGMNLVRGSDSPTVSWNNAFMNGLVQSAILRYLAVAHYGRGRGPWQQSEAPASWKSLVENHLELQSEDLHAIWKIAKKGDPDKAKRKLHSHLSQSLKEILRILHPGSDPF